LNHTDITKILEWFDGTLKWDVLNEIVKSDPKDLPPTFGIEDEDKDFSLSYAQLETMNKFRNERNCGPFSMFDNLAEFWPDFDLDLLYDTVVLFFDTYSQNRHKSVIQTPALYLNNHSCDSNKFNYTPHLYNGFTYQYKKMQKLKESIQMTNVSKMHKDQNVRHAQTGTITGVAKKDAHHTEEHKKEENVQGPNPFDFAEIDRGIGRQVDMQSQDSMTSA